MIAAKGQPSKAPTAVAATATCKAFSVVTSGQSQSGSQFYTMQEFARSDADGKVRPERRESSRGRTKRAERRARRGTCRAQTVESEARHARRCSRTSGEHRWIDNMLIIILSQDAKNLLQRLKLIHTYKSRARIGHKRLRELFEAKRRDDPNI